MIAQEQQRESTILIRHFFSCLSNARYPVVDGFNQPVNSSLARNFMKHQGYFKHHKWIMELQ